jgi:membrane associated rhomboid family serine protease
MLFIPVGLDKSEVRRIPWVSFSLIGVNILVFVLLWMSSLQSSVKEELSGKAEAVAQYLGQHPYLKVPYELEPYLDASSRHQLEDAQAAASRTRPVDYVVRRQQQTLNEMVLDLFATVRRLPLLKWGYVPGQPHAHQLLTCLFVHAGWLHLIGNMLFLFATGPFLEDVYGRPLFLLLYFSSGLIATLAHTWQNPGSLAPVIGASGAIAGVLGAFLVRLGTSRIRFLWLPIPLLFFWRVRLAVPAFVILPLWFAEQFWLATSGQEGAVALWAHVGGFAYGVVFALLVAATGLEKRLIHPSIERQVGFVQNVELVAAIEAGARGNLDQARRTTRGVLASDPSNIDARRLAYDTALEAQDVTEAVQHAARLLDYYVARNEDALARDLIAEISNRADASLPARFSLRAGDFFEKQGDIRQARREYERLLENHPAEESTLRALLRLADLSGRDGAASDANSWLDRASGHPACSSEWRALVEKKRKELFG